MLRGSSLVLVADAAALLASDCAGDNNGAPRRGNPDD
jgi:hypothetical protein